MRLKRSFAILCCWLVCIIALANDSISTIYNKGEFRSYCAVDMVADMSTADKVIDDLIEQFCGNPERLFDWAFKGLGNNPNDKNRNEVLIILKSTTYDKTTGISRMVVDIKVAGTTMYKDVPIESQVTRTRLANGGTKVFVDIFYSNSILKKTYGTFYAIPQKNGKIQMSVHTSVRFGWFFNIFITNRRFKNIVEWREQGFMNNMREETERRYKNTK